jgi:hypothetical protein
MTLHQSNFPFKTPFLAERPVPPELGHPALEGIPPFIRHFFTAEWIVADRSNPAEYVIRGYSVPVANGYSEPGFVFFNTYKEFLWNSLLDIVRSISCLINKRSPMVEVSNGFAFNEDFNKERLDMVGGFPEGLPSPNFSKSELNFLNGTFTLDEAVTRAKNIKKSLKDSILFLNRAYDLFGQSDEWDFHGILSHANNGCINATKMGSAMLVSANMWHILADSDNHVADSILNYGVNVTTSYHEDSDLSSDEHLSQPSPPLHDNSPSTSGKVYNNEETRHTGMEEQTLLHGNESDICGHQHNDVTLDGTQLPPVTDQDPAISAHSFAALANPIINVAHTSAPAFDYTNPYHHYLQALSTRIRRRTYRCL